MIIFLTPSGALVQLMEVMEHGDEGDVINVCTELVVIEGGLKRPLLVATTILSGTADCKPCILMHVTLLFFSHFTSRRCRFQ